MDFTSHANALFELSITCSWLFIKYLQYHPWILFIALGICILNIWLFSSTDNSQGPPLLPVSLATWYRHGLHTFDVLAAKNIERFPHGIFTVSVFGRQIYVINSPDVIMSIQGRLKYTSFRPTMIRATVTLAGQESRAKKILFKDIDKTDSEKGERWSQDMHKLVLKTLMPGPTIDGMAMEFVKNFNGFLGSLMVDMLEAESTTVDIWKWFCESMTEATSYAVWGPSNPFSVQKELWKDFWVFNDSYNFFNYALLPSVLAPRGVAARNRIANAFTDFQQNGGLADASSLGYSRISLLMKLGLTNAETARMAVPATVGQTGNTVPVSYAILAYILSDPSLLSRIRNELEKLIDRQDETHASFDATKARSSCPLLVSTFFEVMRIISLGTTFRNVMEDFVLDVGQDSDSTQYVLKKGALIWSAGGVIHHSSKFYPDADKFKPDRFLGHSNPETQLSGLFRAFGGGTSICSGRHLASLMIIAAIGSLLVRFDFEPVLSSSGVARYLVLPERKYIAWGHAMPNPKGNTMIKVKLRKGYENIIWDYSEKA